MARGVSTVLDVSLCLLLVGVAVTTLFVGVPVEDEEPAVRADSTARTVATATATVPSGLGHATHDTLAGHLGAAAVLDSSIDGDWMTDSKYPGSVREAVASSTSRRVFVTARWEPYPGAPLSGGVSVGDRPPRDASVAVTRLTTDSGVRQPTDATTFEDLSRELASAYVSWLFPPERTRALLVDARTAPAVSTRYRRAGDGLAVDVRPAVTDARVRRGNNVLTEALAARLRRDLRERYDSPAAARGNVTTGSVDITVRRWEP
ncbi:hypothetical protein KY092_14450 [Natronomonas gomsonensis]|uniref:DUF7284 family protein n=1 Tax=Natronomonas gomsonensis TaxID=1046043 RepID=UPI0020CA59DE|nr:hypothetical protein [Natronomonas gomsonensis]MCY4731756.1 hypothetical protein [Natronomonas gomsonensis]